MNKKRHSKLNYSQFSIITNRLAVPPVKLTTISNRAFSVVGPWTWNDLPDDVTAAESLSTFRQRLKTQLVSESIF